MKSREEILIKVSGLQIETINQSYKWVLTAMSEFAAQYEERVKELEAFVNDCATNWDCDNDGHRYNTPCRRCNAEKLLPSPPQTPSTKPI